MIRIWNRGAGHNHVAVQTYNWLDSEEVSILIWGVKAISPVSHGFDLVHAVPLA